MGDDEHTEFRFDFGGIKLELRGERSFFEEMYRQVMKDVQMARRQIQDGGDKGQVNGRSTDDTTEAPPKRQSMWVHRTSDLMRKIYMVPQSQIRQWPLGDVIDLEGVSNMYVDKDVFKDIFPGITEGRTLWAEFTSVGKKKIAQATEPSRKALGRGDQSGQS